MIHQSIIYSRDNIGAEDQSHNRRRLHFIEDHIKMMKRTKKSMLRCKLLKQNASFVIHLKLSQKIFRSEKCWKNNFEKKMDLV